MNINFLWIGKRLNKLSQLGLKSFLGNDHEVTLWVYDKNCTEIPDGVKVEDAGQIIHPDNVFSYVGNGDCRKGSYGGFSDIFRYTLLHKVGGWYCDTDVTCLSNFEPLDDRKYVFRPNKTTLSVPNILKCPKESVFLSKCIEDTKKVIDENNNKWAQPLFIFSDLLKEMDLDKYIVTESFFGIDSVDFINNLISVGYFPSKFELPKYAIHWCNEAIYTGQWNGSLRVNTETATPTTLYYKLLKKYNLL
jgi:hypothetical protein